MARMIGDLCRISQNAEIVVRCLIPDCDWEVVIEVPIVATLRAVASGDGQLNVSVDQQAFKRLLENPYWDHQLRVHGPRLDDITEEPDAPTV